MSDLPVGSGCMRSVSRGILGLLGQLNLPFGLTVVALAGKQA
jgi:hypothetical protein